MHKEILSTSHLVFRMKFGYNSSINSVALPAGTYRIRMYVGDFVKHGNTQFHIVSLNRLTEMVHQSHLDLDSDNDGCADALERRRKRYCFSTYI